MKCKNVPLCDIVYLGPLCELIIDMAVFVLISFPTFCPEGCRVRGLTILSLNLTIFPLTNLTLSRFETLRETVVESLDLFCSTPSLEKLDDFDVLFCRAARDFPADKDVLPTLSL